jgi:PAS domain S-box-containing protein
MRTNGTLARDAVSLAPARDQGDLDSHGHSVQFYGSDTFLMDEVSHFIGSALGEGNVGLIIATRMHREGLAERLRSRGLDLALAARQGRYIPLDAFDTLAEFMLDGWPDARRFSDVMESVMKRATLKAKGTSPRVAAFGEMVALLCAEGKADAAIRLEELWNDLARKYAFQLHCAYPMSLFGQTNDEAALQRICAEHSRVVPVESYASLIDEADRLRNITFLQQKARALETEVDERKKVQQALQRREAELADFLENALEGVQQVGADQIIRWANRAQLELLGYAAEDYVGQPLGEFYFERSVFDGFWRKLMSREDIYDYPADLRCKDGSVKSVLIHSNGLWENGQFVHTRCFIRDISEQKRLEQVLRESVLRAEAAVQVRDKFLAIASHELKTPVTTLKGSAQLLLRRQARGELDEQRLKRMLVVLEKSANQLAQLTSDLLDVSRIQTGHLPLAGEALDLAALVRGAVNRACDQAEDNSWFEASVPAEAAVVWGDFDRLNQVLTNLLDNARKYSAARGLVTVQLTEAPDNGLEVAVQDRGIGLPPGTEDAIFEPFGRAPNAAASPVPGMGLGLYICRTIVERHGGRIWAESPGEGLGTTCFVWLPRCPASTL